MPINDIALNYWDRIVQGFIGQNTFQDYLMFLGVFVGIFLLLLFIDKFVIRLLEKTAKKTKNLLDDYIVGFLKNLG